MVKSPKTQPHVTTTNSEQFSPISKPTTPKTTQGKNLTGTARHIRDLTADIHSLIQKWNTLHLQGFSILKNITREEYDKCYSQSLQELCDNLDCVCDGLDAVVQSLHQITHQFKTVATLNKNDDKLFMMWPAEKFGHVAETIYKAYFHENQVKRKILEDIADNATESWKMLCLSAWVHQPLLPDNMTSLLESLLLETGHR